MYHITCVPLSFIVSATTKKEDATGKIAIGGLFTDDTDEEGLFSAPATSVAKGDMAIHHTPI
jgi:hypothetical protein